jgi:hypothetical protein
MIFGYLPLDVYLRAGPTPNISRASQKTFPTVILEYLYGCDSASRFSLLGISYKVWRRILRLGTGSDMENITVLLQDRESFRSSAD